MSIQEENSKDLGSVDLNFDGSSEDQQEGHVVHDEMKYCRLVLKHISSTHETSLSDGEKEQGHKQQHAKETAPFDASSSLIEKDYQDAGLNTLVAGLDRLREPYSKQP